MSEFRPLRASPSDRHPSETPSRNSLAGDRTAEYEALSGACILTDSPGLEGNNLAGMGVSVEVSEEVAFGYERNLWQSGPTPT